MKKINIILITLVIILISNTAFSQELEWAIQAGGTASGSEYISEIAFDSEGNIYATGKIGDGATIGEGANQVTVSTEGAFDLFVAKYDTDGNLIWFFTEAGPAGNAAQFINVDADGNIYIAGAFSESLTFDNETATPVTITNTVGLGDMYVACYNSNQEFQWVKQITASDNFSTSNGIDMDSDNNIILSGYFRGYITVESTTLTNSDPEEGYYDLYVIKLNSIGELDWAFSAGSNESWDRVYGATFDNNGNILITGKFRNNLVLGKPGNQITLTAPAYTDLYVAKFDTDANILWANSASSPYTATGKALTTDDEGNCYVTGYFQNTCLFGEGTPNEFEITNPGSTNAENFLVAKYDINGNFQWVRQTTTLTSMGRGTNATIDNNQNLHIAGWFENTITFQDGTSITSETAGYCDIFFVEFNPDGELLAINQENGSYREYASTIKFDNNNNMFIAGRFGDNTEPQTMTFGKDDNQITLTSVKWDDIFFVKYSPEIPPVTYSVTFNITDELEPQITLTGYGTQTAIAGATIFTDVEETPSPGIEFTANLVGYEVYTDNVIVDGDEIVEINLIPTNIQSLENQISIYPNPSNGIFTVTNPQGFKNLVGLEITDITGKIIYSKDKAYLVSTTTQIDLTRGHAHLHKGIYFITINTAKGIFTQKLIIQ